MENNFEQSNILICGSSRVGKTTLINAICRQELAKSNASLNSQTKTIDRYSSRTVIGNITHETNFWDTPGIESWNEADVRNYMASLIEQTHPLCMIYCASPGSFAVLHHVGWMITECHRKKIFCALVCTNMWTGRNRQCVVDEFCAILNSLHPEIKPTKEDGVIYYDRIALVTMVNSIEYCDLDFGITKPPSGINELIYGIAKCLQRDFMIAWFRTVSKNTSFWSTMSSKICSLLKVPYEKFNSLYQHAENFLDSFLDLLDSDNDEEIMFTRQSNSTDTNETIFHDAEMVEMSEIPKPKQLLFTLKSKEMLSRLSDALVQLGVNRMHCSPFDNIDQEKYILTSEFDDEKKLKAVYDIYEIISQTEVTCKILDEPLKFS